MVEIPLVTIPILPNTHLFIEKGSDITWHVVKYEFIATEIKENIEDIQVYVNI